MKKLSKCCGRKVDFIPEAMQYVCYGCNEECDTIEVQDVEKEAMKTEDKAEEVLTPRQYLEQFPNAKPEKTIDWLGFALDYSKYCSSTKDVLSDKKIIQALKKVIQESNEREQRLYKQIELKGLWTDGDMEKAYYEGIKNFDDDSNFTIPFSKWLTNYKEQRNKLKHNQ